MPSCHVAKSALGTWTIALSLKLAKATIRVHFVLPGTPETQSYLANIARMGGKPEDVGSRTELHRRGTLIQPEEIAVAVKFLLSPKPLGISCASIHVDGGPTTGCRLRNQTKANGK